MHFNYHTFSESLLYHPAQRESLQLRQITLREIVLSIFPKSPILVLHSFVVVLLMLNRLHNTALEPGKAVARLSRSLGLFVVASPRFAKSLLAWPIPTPPPLPFSCIFLSGVNLSLTKVLRYVQYFFYLGVHDFLP